MKVKLWLKYKLGYLPNKRCRILRYKDEEKFIEVDIREIEAQKLTPAFNVETMIYSFDERLWTKATERDIHCGNPEKPMTALEALIYSGVTYSTYFAKSAGYPFNNSDYEKEEDVMLRIEKDMNKYVIVDGELYLTTREPMYCIYTFGLGHNHAGIGTSLSVVNWYNENISKTRYFNALDFDKAMESALQIALNRGDTKSTDYIKGTTPIHVYDAKFVTRNPEVDHGEGSAFLNSIEGVIENSESMAEAGIMTIVLTGTN